MNISNKIESKNIQDILALTPLQEGMLFHYLQDHHCGLYFEQLSLEISGEIHGRHFEKAWDVVIDTNEMLRTVFRWEKVEKPSQIILKKHKCNVIFYDLSDKDSSQKNTLLEEIKNKDRRETFDLHRVPFRVILCKLEEKTHAVIISNHHILYDGWSNGIILKEFFMAYQGLCQGGRSLKLPIKPAFKEFIKWVQRQDTHKQEQFWKKYLAGLETLTELPIKKRGEETTGAENYSIILEKDIRVKLDVFVKNNRLTLAPVFYTTWGILLQKYCGCEDVIFGTTVSGRSAGIKGIEDMVGLFINTLPLRVQAAPDFKMIDIVSGVENLLPVREEFEHTPLVDIWGYSPVSGSTSLFDTIVVIENYPLDTRLLAEDSLLSVNSYSTTEMTHYDLTVAIMPYSEIEIKFSFKRELFDKKTIENLAGHFRKILRNIIENPATTLSQLEIISSEEKNRILFEFNDTAVEYPADQTIHQLFEEQAKRTPDNIAAAGEMQSAECSAKSIEQNKELHAPCAIRCALTYRELNDRANRLAHLLIEKGVRADNIVGIMVERSVEMIVGIMGILKAGSAYLPIDPEYPQERIDYMLKDSSANALVTTSTLAQEIKKLKSSEVKRTPETIFIDAMDATNPSPSQLLNFSTSYSLAYIIYTSGTTGQPKGTLIEHRNVVRLLFNDKFQFDFSDRDVWTLFHSYCFDFSVWEMYGAMLYGGKLVIVPQMMARDTIKFLELLTREAVTVLNQTPAAFYNLINEGLPHQRQENNLYLKYVIFGGEALNPLKLKTWREKYSRTRLINMFGITETTVHVTYKEINQKDTELNISNIGKPIPTLSAYILDKYFKPVPLGVTGEIWVGGDGVARGYLNQVELTAAKFIENPYQPGNRLYRSGDTGRFLENGDMEYLGRIDNQVKIRGFRIELGEIENQLLKYGEIKNAVVLAGETPNEKNLCAYIVVDQELALTGLRTYLSAKLPDYMIPSYFVRLEQIPLTPNGKVDRGALPKPELKVGASYTAPRDEIEKKLVEIWKDILNPSPDSDVRIGIADHFFELGGHSLKAAILVSRLEKVFDVKIPLPEIFKKPRIRELAGYIKKAVPKKYKQVELVEKKEYYALSSAQQRLYFLQQMDKDGPWPSRI